MNELSRSRHLVLTPTGERSAIHSAPAIRVVIADDHPLYRHGLVDLLRRDGIVVLADVPNGDAAIEAALRLRPDAVVMDLNMPGVSGLEATRFLVAAEPRIRVLILTVSAQDDDVAEALAAGAVGYVLKDAPVEDIVAAVRAAATGSATISERLAEAAADPVRPDSRPPARRPWSRFRRSARWPS